MQITVVPSDILEGDLGEAARASEVPETYQVKGMFFSRLKERLGPLWNEVLPTLVGPPRFGHYVPFKDYPQQDYFAMTLLIADRLYPGCSPREGMRRLAREDFEIFSSSAFGRIVLASVGDAHSALMAVATVYSKVASGDWTVRGTEVDESTVRLEWIGVFGCWEYQLGQIEGVLRHYGTDYRILYESPSESHWSFDIRHGNL